MKILETTLRDGSYAIDFKFTPKDTAIIAYALEQAGFELIEIGHGLGLHAKEMGKGDSAALDIDYIEATASVLKKAKFGMFCIPGIARLGDIDNVAKPERILNLAKSISKRINIRHDYLPYEFSLYI